MAKLIGVLPKRLEVDGEFYDIDSDFRTVLLIMQMYNDRALSNMTKHKVMLQMLYTTTDSVTGEAIVNIPPKVDLAVKAAMNFLNYGETEDDEKSKEQKEFDDEFGDIIDELSENKVRTIDYEHDERLIFSAINPIYSRDIREDNYLHWYTFCDLCMAIDSESLISQVVGIRQKISKGKKLDKHEADFYRKNQKIVDIPGTYGNSSGVKDASGAIEEMLGL